MNVNEYKPIPVLIEPRGRYSSGATAHNMATHGYEAGCALHFVEKWGAISAVPDGEDSSGRQKLRLQTPAELVERATETAALLYSKLRELGWMTEFKPEDVLPPKE